MEKTTIKLSSGRLISSGLGDDAIVSLRLTRAVNSETELSVGAVCAAMAEIVLIVQEESPIAQADTFTLFRGERQVGVFIAEKPQWISAHRVKILAYDPVTLLDQDLSSWLKTLTPWPVTLGDLAKAVCNRCGVTLADTPFPDQDYPAKPFAGNHLTGRKILSWIAQAAGRFCTADENGILHFGWYAPVSGVTIGPKKGDSIQGILHDGDPTITGISAHLEEDSPSLQGNSDAALNEGDLTLQSGTRQHHYYQGSLELADFETAPIEKVQIRQDSADIGVMYPDIGMANTYVLSANPLLTAQTPEEVLPIAQRIFEQLKNICYTPCTVTVDADTGLKPGNIITVTDIAGRRATVYLMESCLSGTKETFKCTGSATRASVSAVHDSSWQALSGKVLRLQTDVEGLRAENADAAGNSAAIAMSVSAIESKVTAQVADLDSMKQQLTTLQQEKDSLQLKIQTIEENGVSQVVTTTGYRFSEEGLRISKSGMEMENLLDHTGMCVSRNGRQILRADNRGVAAADVSVSNYLIIGDHARFEDYDGGTACFYI